MMKRLTKVRCLIGLGLVLGLALLVGCAPKPVDQALAAMERELAALEAAIQKQSIDRADAALRAFLKVQEDAAPYAESTDPGQRQRLNRLIQRGVELSQQAQQMVKRSGS